MEKNRRITQKIRVRAPFRFLNSSFFPSGGFLLFGDRLWRPLLPPSPPELLLSKLPQDPRSDTRLAHFSFKTLFVLLFILVHPLTEQYKADFDISHRNPNHNPPQTYPVWKNPRTLRVYLSFVSLFY